MHATILPRWVMLCSFILVLALGFIPTESKSQHQTNAHVKYQKASGEYSDFYYREVTVIGGRNLNRETDSQDYSSDKDYVLVWFDQDEVSIIELRDSEFTDISTPEISKGSFEITIEVDGFEYKGLDQSGRFWKVCFTSKGMDMLCD